jgi:serine/threonine-protein kinase
LAKKSSDPQLTQPGIVLGSVHYMSPEQVKGSADLDRRSDIYSLGIVLYEAVTGKKPFDSKSQFEVFLAHVNEEPAPPSSVRPEIPPQLDEIILTAIAKQPANRFQTAEEFQESLGKLQSILENPVAERGAAPPPQAHGSVSENPVGQAADPPVETTPGERVAAGTSAPGDPRDDAARSESGWLESAPNSVPVSVSHGVADSVTDAAAAPVVESAAGSVAEPAPVSPRVAARVPADVGETNPVMPEAFLPPPAEASGCWDVLSVDRDLGDGDGSQASSPPNPQPASEEPAFAPGHTGWSEYPARSRSTSSTSERTTPANESADHSKPVPILLRPSGDTGGYPRYSPPVDDSPAEPESPEPSRPGEQTFAGWSSKDILAVGALMFVIVAAVFFTLLTFLNYR